MINCKTFSSCGFLQERQWLGKTGIPYVTRQKQLKLEADQKETWKAEVDRYNKSIAGQGYNSKLRKKY